MDTRRVGRSGLTVSRLGLGTLMWGRDTSADDAAAQLEAFADAGGTLIETSNVYGDGDAESVIGELVPAVMPRSRLVLATTTVGVSGRGALLSALDGSLARLGTDHVELWLVHGFDPAVPYAETCQAMRTALDSGRAAYVGVSGHTGWQLATEAAYLRTMGTPMVAAASEYSLLEREPEDGLLPAAAVHEVGLLAWGPLGRGVLTGKYRRGTPADSRAALPHFERYVARHRTEGADRIVGAVATAAEGLGSSPLAVALAWLRDRPGVASAIVGARHADQLTGSLASENVTLPEEIRAALDEVSLAEIDGDHDS